MPKSVKNMLEEANASVPKLPPADAAKMMTGENVLIVDVRDPSEVEKSGKIKGAVNVSRGMLEFRADSESQYHNPAFDKGKTVSDLLRLWRSLSLGRQDAEGDGLRDGLQYRRLQRVGRCRTGNGACLAELRWAGAQARPQFVN